MGRSITPTQAKLAGARILVVDDGEDGAQQRIPAIALTAYASKKDRDLALNAGFDEHWSKPVDVTALTLAIERPFRPVSTHEATS